MARRCSFFVGLVFVAVLATQTFSADCTKNGVIISSATGGTLSIKVTGIYDVDPNYKLKAIQLFAMPGPNGGEGGFEEVKGKKGSFQGVIAVPEGTYTVQ